MDNLLRMVLWVTCIRRFSTFIKPMGVVFIHDWLATYSFFLFQSLPFLHQLTKLHKTSYANNIEKFHNETLSYFSEITVLSWHVFLMHRTFLNYAIIWLQTARL